MEPPRRSNVSATSAVILLLVFVAAGMMVPIGAKRPPCSHLSATFHGVCVFNRDCAAVCVHESPFNIGGACGGFPGRCYCETIPPLCQP
ncbi:unnamed protein product [Urochloa decumbens]|uniref:Knottins-like domain-containing protein n=1 Tax=Urochloa decumbens TaxID=240449 RepID=A0ABC9C325_9POAL